MKTKILAKFRFTFLVMFHITFLIQQAHSQNTNDILKINDLEYFETQGVNILVFSNWYNDNFSDSKISGIEIIHHGVRTASNGDVRLNPTPEQWDQIPQFIKREINKEENSIEAFLTYPDYDFNFRIKVTGEGNGVTISVLIDEPLPGELAGIAGLNIEFLPSAYFKKSYLMDDQAGLFPLYPGGPMKINRFGKTEPRPLISGKKFILAPEDPSRKVTIESKNNELSLFDGRNKAQNGWYVVRSLIPENSTGKVIEWTLNANAIPNWMRQPVIAYSQVGYHPDQKKIAVIELDKNNTPLTSAQLLKITEDGNYKEAFTGTLTNWGKYKRYNYLIFDFSSVTDAGTYVIKYGDLQIKPVLIAKNVYKNAWHPTLDVFFPVQMDHMFVNEAYRVWHGASHLDDALQAPVNHIHFDLYAQGPTTDSRYEPGEHIPGLNIGGWFDAGDFDIRTQTQYNVVLNMVHTWEMFRPDRDETYINQETRYVDIHHPDNKPDLLQQIEHGTLALIAQHRAFGHAIPGIIASSLSQYTHLGDAITKTDNLIYDSNLDSLESDGFKSGTFDDRWAFTTRTSALNFGSIASLAAASRVLKELNPSLANECIETAIKVWNDEHSHEPILFMHGNTTGGRLFDEELKASVELLITTKEKKYAKRIEELLPVIKEDFNSNAIPAIRSLPYMNDKFKQKIKNLAVAYKDSIEQYSQLNPFGVPITEGGWAGNGYIVRFAITNYMLHKAFPDIIDKEHVLKGLNYIYGCHPDSNISFVSGVGANSKMVAYGNNRADFSFIAGGVVPGVLILNPDFPENKEDWPFLWGENEYVVNLASEYIFIVNAVDDLLK